MIVDNRGCIRFFVGPPFSIRKIQQSHLYLMNYIHYKKKRTIFYLEKFTGCVIIWSSQT